MGILLNRRLYICYTPIMKTAVYLPDDLFKTAEKIAKRLKLSRSQLYSKAIKEYIGDLNNEAIIDKLNEVYGENVNESKIDERIHKAQLNILEQEEW